jgi:hypothetical protein
MRRMDTSLSWVHAPRLRALRDSRAWGWYSSPKTCVWSLPPVTGTSCSIPGISGGGAYQRGRRAAAPHILNLVSSEAPADRRVAELCATPGAVPTAKSVLGHCSFFVRRKLAKDGWSWKWPGPKLRFLLPCLCGNAARHTGLSRDLQHSTRRELTPCRASVASGCRSAA